MFAAIFKILINQRPEWYQSDLQYTHSHTLTHTHTHTAPKILRYHHTHTHTHTTTATRQVIHSTANKKYHYITQLPNNLSRTLCEATPMWCRNSYMYVLHESYPHTKLDGEKNHLLLGYSRNGNTYVV